MPKITRSAKGGIDTDGDTEADVEFSITPADGGSYPHPASTEYTIHVENNRTHGDLQVMEQFAPPTGAPAASSFWRKVGKPVAPGDRDPIKSVTLEHPDPPHQGLVNLEHLESLIVVVDGDAHLTRIVITHQCGGKG